MTPEKIGLKAVRWIDRATDRMIQIVMMVALLFGLYSLWDSHQVYQAADAANYTAYRPTAEDPVSFEELQAMNPEVFAWLTVNDTPIDYPMTQTDNNEKYINTNAEGQYTLSGAIFLDYRNSRDFEDFNSIVYGHHMEKKMMFGALSDFADKAYFDNHKYGNLYYGGRDHGLEFFALILTDAYDEKLFTPDVKSEEEKEALLNHIFSKAMYTRDIPVTLDDRIVLLSTCTSSITNGRYMLVGRITDEVYPQEIREVRPVIRLGSGISGQISRLRAVPVWLWVLLLIILITLTVLSERIRRR